MGQHSTIDVRRDCYRHSEVCAATSFGGWKPGNVLVQCGFARIVNKYIEEDLDIETTKRDVEDESFKLLILSPIQYAVPVKYFFRFLHL